VAQSPSIAARCRRWGGIPDTEPYGVQILEGEVEDNREMAEQQGYDKLAHNRNRAEITDDDSAEYREKGEVTRKKKMAKSVPDKILDELKSILSKGNKKKVWDEIRDGMIARGSGEFYEKHIEPRRDELIVWSASQFSGEDA